MYIRDRPPNSKRHSHGGVLIAINTEFDSTEVNSLRTECEIVWVELTIQNSRKLLLSSFYRPQPNDDVSLEKLNQSLRRLNPNSKSIIIVSGDFNLVHIDWTSSSIIPGKPNVKQHQDILDIIADHSLTQIVDKPTRNDKTVDLIITNYPSIVDNFETIPPIGEADHDILSLVEITVSLRRCKHKPRQVSKKCCFSTKYDEHRTNPPARGRHSTQPAPRSFARGQRRTGRVFFVRGLLLVS